MKYRLVNTVRLNDVDNCYISSNYSLSSSFSYSYFGVERSHSFCKR